MSGPLSLADSRMVDVACLAPVVKPGLTPCSYYQGASDEKGKEAANTASKKSPGAKPLPKPPKEKVVKPKKEISKPGKVVKPGPTAKAKVAAHQPGVVRGITYYKASKTDEDEQGEGESSSGTAQLLYFVIQHPSVEHLPILCFSGLMEDRSW